MVDRKAQTPATASKWFAVLPLGLAATACAVPWLLGHMPEVGFALQRGFALVCHQRAERSFFLFGGTVAVCARCLGIYLGAAAGLWLRVSREWAWRGFAIVVALNVLDWGVEVAGLHGNWTWVRLAMGTALGGACAMLAASTTESVRPVSAGQGAVRA